MPHLTGQGNSVCLVRLRLVLIRLVSVRLPSPPLLRKFRANVSPACLFPASFWTDPAFFEVLLFSPPALVLLRENNKGPCAGGPAGASRLCGAMCNGSPGNKTPFQSGAWRQAHQARSGGKTSLYAAGTRLAMIRIQDTGRHCAGSLPFCPKGGAACWPFCSRRMEPSP